MKLLRASRQRILRGVPVAALLWVSPMWAQSPTVGGEVDPNATLYALQERCALVGGEALHSRCGDAALAFEGWLLGTAAALSGGSPLPASPSTAGRRLPGDPRVVMDGGLLLGTFRTPDLSAGGAGSASRRTVTGARGTIALGLFEGFSPAPTVGGVLGVDLLATVRYASEAGSGGGSAMAWGAGARVGVVRESFTLPGVTLSALHLRSAEFRHAPTGTEAASVAVRPTLTALRATVGKDLLALGISAGGGVDRIRGTGRITVPREEGSGSAGAAIPGQADRYTLSRPVAFAGVNFTWIVLQVAGELTWSPSVDPVPGVVGTGGYTSPGTGLSGALTLRLTY